MGDEMKIVIRNVKKEDIPNVVDLNIEAWRKAYKGIIDDEFLDSMDRDIIIERRKNDYQNGCFIVAENNNQIVGFCRYDDKVNSEDSSDFDCEIIALYVKYDLKGQGIGREMINYVKTDLKKKGKNKLIVWCLKENYPSRKFYEKMGGLIIGEHNTTFGGKEYPEVGFGYDL